MPGDGQSLAQKIDFLFTSVTQTVTDVAASETAFANIQETDDIQTILDYGKNAPPSIEFDDVDDAYSYNITYKCASVLKSAPDDDTPLSTNEVSTLNKLICKIDTILSSQISNTNNNNVLRSQTNTLKTKNSNIDGKLSQKHTLTMIMFIFLILQIIVTLLMYFYDNEYGNLALVIISLLVLISILSTIVYDTIKRIETFDAQTPPDAVSTCATVISDTDRTNAYALTLSRIENILRKVMANKNFIDEMRIHTNRSFVLMKQYQLKDYKLRRLAFQRTRIRYAYVLVSLIGILFYIRNGNIIDTQLMSLFIGGLVIMYLIYYAMQSKQNMNRSLYNWERINWGQYEQDDTSS